MKVFLSMIGHLLFLASAGLAQNTIVEGVIRHFNPSSQDTSIRICHVPIGIGLQECELLSINEIGGFYTELDLYRENELLLCYDHKCRAYPILPKQKVFFEIDAEEFKKSALGSRTITTEGDNQETYAIINDFWPNYADQFWYSDESQTPLNEIGADLGEYAMSRLDRLKAELAFLNAYVEKKQIADTLFLHWISGHIRLKCLVDIKQFYFTRSHELAIVLPKEYKEFFSDLSNLETLAGSYSRYLPIYLHMIKEDLITRFQSSQSGRELIMDQVSIWGKQLEFIIGQPEIQGRYRDILLGQILSLYLEYDQVALVQANISVIKDEKIKKLILSNTKK